MVNELEVKTEALEEITGTFELMHPERLRNTSDDELRSSADKIVMQFQGEFSTNLAAELINFKTLYSMTTTISHELSWDTRSTWCTANFISRSVNTVQIVPQDTNRHRWRRARNECRTKSYDVPEICAIGQDRFRHLAILAIEKKTTGANLDLSD